ncbi:unnamed protein product [Arabidopsis halleri]
MAKEMVTLAFIFAIVLSAFSPMIGKAEILENRNLKPLSEGETVFATNEDEHAPSRRYGPWIRQPIFKSRDAPARGSVLSECSSKVYVESCNECDSLCKFLFPGNYGQCEGLWPVRDCYCYHSCL